MTDCLETSKLALERGLIDVEDFNRVKTAFLKAQQIKAGLDAGFIRQDDYDQVKNAFLSSLLDTLAVGQTSAVVQSSVPTANTNGTVSVTPPSPITSSVPPSPAPKTFQAPEPVARVMPPPAAAVAPAPIASPQPTAAAAEPAPVADQPPMRQYSGTVPVPVNIPRLGGQKGNLGGISISGIAISDDAVNLYYHMKAKALYRWAMWKVDSAGKNVVIATVGDKDSTFDDFLANLPPNDCRYAVYDYPYVNSEGVVYTKIVFLNWAPDTAIIRSKMMYAATKDFFKSCLDGISVEFQASELDEIQEADVHQSVSELVVRK